MICDLPSRTRFHGFEPEAVARLGRNINLQPTYCRPSIQHLPNVYAMPGRAALYFPDGRVVPGTQHSFAPDNLPLTAEARAAVAGKQQAAAPDQVEIGDHAVVKRPVIWGGEIIEHYGHFLSESVGRLWALFELGDMPVAFTVRGRSDPNAGFIQDFFAALGISDRLMIVTEPTRFLDVIAPETAIQHVHRLYHQFDRPHLRVADTLDQGPPTTRGAVYLSRSQLGGGRGGADHEVDLEDALAARGVEILHPEGMSLADQIAVFRHSALVIGLGGSAFHSSLFVRRGAGATMAVITAEKPNRRLLQFDALKGTETHYIRACVETGYRQPVRLNVSEVLSALTAAGLVEGMRKRA